MRSAARHLPEVEDAPSDGLRVNYHSAIEIEPGVADVIALHYR
jgi:hypothetical protein